MSKTSVFAMRGLFRCDISITVLSSATLFLSGCGSADGNTLSDGGACPAGQVLRYETPGCGAAALAVCGAVDQDACSRPVCSCQGLTISSCDYAPEPFSAFGACATPDGGLDLRVDNTPTSAPDATLTNFEVTPEFDGGPSTGGAVLTVTVGTTKCSDGRVLRTTEFPLTTPYTNADGIAAGTDGNLWFAECFANKIGRINSQGTITEFSLPTPEACPTGITSGPDGSLWFTELYGGRIGRINAQGEIVEFPIPTAGGWPYNIAAGPDGNLWFTERMGNKIGRISPQGTVAEFPIPPAAYANQTQEPWDIAAGPDGNLWFTYGPNLGRATPAGAIVLFAIPNAIGGTGGITAGSDGNVWFTEVGYAGDESHSIGRITPQGAITELGGPAPGAVPGDMVAGPDGSLWFTQAPMDVTSGRLVGRIGPDGTFAECPGGRANTGAQGIAVGADGNLWLSETGEIIRIEI